mmetsp:Transcript_11269/g.35730  ORF Transcript_11269/g.35730 Transcript_11269/m.35730 type:complete len:116 (-) Transcript_11269:19-366(-)
MADEARGYGPPASGRVAFGRFEIDPRQVFYQSETCLAIVNLKPLVPGHVLVVPKRVVTFLRDLGDAEHAELWRAAHAVSTLVKTHHGKSAANIAVQDGPDAGQSVPHVHVHVLPR